MKSNPFSSRFTAPGKTPFFFDRSFCMRLKAAHPAKFEFYLEHALGLQEDIRRYVCMHLLVDLFETRQCRGQIVGGHGSGKSTLMHALKQEMTSAGYEVFSWSLHDQQRFIPDAFWFGLQEFLQQTPKFMPTQCLLPPPVVSRDDYLAQQRESMRFILEGEYENGPDEEELDEIETVEQYQATGSRADEPAQEPESSREGSDVSDAESEPESPFPRKGYLGFNSAGNFGFNRASADDDESRASMHVGAETERVDFAPFPGIAPANEDLSAQETSKETSENASVKPMNAEPASGARTLFSVALNEQKKLAIPLPAESEYRQNRSFFEKKVVFFDGFEQLSYANRIVLRTFCRMNRLGLMIATHTPAIGIPVLYRACPQVETLRMLLDFLLDDPNMIPDDSELAILLANFHNDVREILFSLYDAYEKYSLAPREVRENIVRNYPR